MRGSWQWQRGLRDIRGLSAGEGEITQHLLVLITLSTPAWEHRVRGKGAESLLYLLSPSSCSVRVSVMDSLGAALNPTAAASPGRERG